MITHEQLVKSLAKPGDEIAATVTPNQLHMLHMVLGVAGEAGELVDAVKKHVIYCKEIDLENVIEELGDLEFYMEGLRAALGIKREETIERNIAKLLKRYHSGSYSNSQAAERADKAQHGKTLVEVFSREAVQKGRLSLPETPIK